MFYFQLVIMAGTVLLAYYFEYTDTFPVHVQGFFCYDKSFSKPYPGPDDTSKIPPVLIYSLVTAIPSLTVRSVYIYIFFKVSLRCVRENEARGQKDGAQSKKLSKLRLGALSSSSTVPPKSRDESSPVFVPHRRSSEQIGEPHGGNPPPGLDRQVCVCVCVCVEQVIREHFKNWVPM